VDRRVPDRPLARVRWPGLPFGLCPCSGAPADVDFQDAHLWDVLRWIADTSRLNVVVHPGVRNGQVTYHAKKVPWDEALERVLAPNGLVARLDGNVVEIGPPRKFGARRAFKGAAISFDYEDKDLIETLREVAAHGHASVEVPEGVMGKVTLKLDGVPWDQAFDLLVRLNGLAWTRTGDVIRVEPPRRTPSR
jgi:type II secretory pathway component HofQ